MSESANEYIKRLEKEKESCKNLIEECIYSTKYEYSNIGWDMDKDVISLTPESYEGISHLLDENNRYNGYLVYMCTI